MTCVCVGDARLHDIEHDTLFATCRFNVCYKAITFCLVALWDMDGVDESALRKLEGAKANQTKQRKEIHYRDCADETKFELFAFEAYSALSNKSKRF